MKYPIVLADLDNTLFDFNADSREALETTFRHFGFPYGDAERDLYFAINHSLWDDFEKGIIEKAMIFPTRWQRYMDTQGLSGEPMVINAFYMENLAKGHNLMPQARMLMEALCSLGCKVCAATNGTTLTQEPRLSRSGLLPFFHKVYISEQVGWQKPCKEYFDHIFAELGEENRKKADIIYMS